MFRTALTWLLCSLSLLSAARYDPALEWNRTDTEHFQIIWHSGEEHLIAHMTTMVEEIYTRITGYLRSEPRHITRILLTDNTDAIQGLASPYPYNFIICSPTPPSPLILGTAAVDWIELVITHEFTHIVQLEMSGGIPAAAGKIFGNINFMNGLQPLWAIEGLAVHTESRFTAGGRQQTGLYNMMERTAVAANAVPPLDRICNYNLIDWPDGNSSYIYGSSLIGYMTETWGDSVLVRLNHRYKKRILPLFSSTLKKVTGLGTAGMYSAWKKSITGKSTQELTALQDNGFTPVERVTEHGFLSGAPTWFPSGKGIAYLQAEPHHHPQVRLRDLTSGKDVKLRHVIASGHYAGPAISPTGTAIAFTQTMPQNLYNSYNDLYVYDFAAHRLDRLTEGGRVSDPCWAPDGEKLVVVKNGTGYCNLYTVSRADGRMTPLTDRTDCVFSHPAWSPEGNRLAVSVKYGGNTDIYLYDFTGPDTLVPVTSDIYLDLTPSWSPDGKYILFSSDRTGIFNLFAYNVSSGRTHRLTSLATGAFAPAMAPDGKRIAFTGYGPEGYDVYMMTLADAALAESDMGVTDTSAVLSLRSVPAAAAPVKSKPYAAFPDVLPRFWLPYIGSGPAGYSYGGFTLGQDLLARHLVEAMVLWNPERNIPEFQAGYRYNRFYPVFSLTAASLPRAIGYTLVNTATGATTDYTLLQRQQQLLAAVSLPGVGGSLGRIFSTDLELGCRYSRISNLSDVPAGYLLGEDRGTIGEWYADYLLTTYNRYLASPVREDGIDLRLFYARAVPELGSDYAYGHLMGHLALYKQLFFTHHVFGLSVTAQQRQGDASLYHRFGIAPRGASMGSGPSQAVGTLEWTFPVAYPQRGYRTWPVFLQKVYGSLFCDADLVEIGEDPSRYSAGAALAADMVFFHGLPYKIKLSWVANRDYIMLETDASDILYLIQGACNGIGRPYCRRNKSRP